MSQRCKPHHPAPVDCAMSLTVASHTFKLESLFLLSTIVLRIPIDGHASHHPTLQVKFDTRDSLSASSSNGSSSTPSVLYCTEGGVLGRTCDASGSANRSSQPAGSSSGSLGCSIISSQPEGSAILSFDVQPDSGQDLLYCTDSFSLVHLTTQQATTRR